MRLLATFADGRLPWFQVSGLALQDCVQNMQTRPTIAHGNSRALAQRGFGATFPDTLIKHTYLDEGPTAITKAVPPGRDCSIALRSWLTPAISPNVGNSTSQFLLVGICVRANP